jgi:hypothetical protein
MRLEMEERELYNLLDSLRGNSRFGISREVFSEMVSHFKSVEQAKVILEKNTHLLSGMEEIAVPAPFIKQFLSGLLSDRQVTTAIDPWAGIGSFLRVVKTIHPEAELKRSEYQCSTL